MSHRAPDNPQDGVYLTPGFQCGNLGLTLIRWGSESLWPVIALELGKPSDGTPAVFTLGPLMFLQTAAALTQVRVQDRRGRVSAQFLAVPPEKLGSFPTSLCC